MWPHVVGSQTTCTSFGATCSRPAVPVHPVEERFVAHPARILFRRRQQRHPHRVEQPQLFEDGTVPQLLLHAGDRPQIADRHARAIAPDQVCAVEAGQGVRIGADQVIDGGRTTHGRAAKQQRKGRSPATPSPDLHRAAPMISSPTRRRSASMPVSRWRVGCTRLVSRAQAQTAPEIDPDARAREAGVTDGRVGAGIAAGPSRVLRLPPQASRRRLPRPHLGKPGFDALQQALRRVEDSVDRAEQAGMAGGTTQCEGVLVMHLAAHHAAAPGAALGRRGLGRDPGARSVRAAAAASPSVHPVSRSIAMPSSMKLISE